MKIIIKITLDNKKYHNKFRSTAANILRSLADDIDNANVPMSGDTTMSLCGNNPADVLGTMIVKE